MRGFVFFDFLSSRLPRVTASGNLIRLYESPSRLGLVPSAYMMLLRLVNFLTDGHGNMTASGYSYVQHIYPITCTARESWFGHRGSEWRSSVLSMRLMSVLIRIDVVKDQEVGQRPYKYHCSSQAFNRNLHCPSETFIFCLKAQLRLPRRPDSFSFTSRCYPTKSSP